MSKNLTPDIIAAAIDGFEAQKLRIDGQIAELRAMLNGGTSTVVATAEIATSGRKRFTAASRRKMALAQKARWAKLRGESEPVARVKLEKPKRQLSEEGRRRIVAATKKRWRLQKAAAKAEQATKPRKSSGTAAQRKALPAPALEERKAS
jgi:hypothetical protein